MVAIFCGKVLAGETPLIFGDGRQTRDYTYVGDIVAANLAAAAHPEAHGAYNIGTGTESTVIDVLSACVAAGWATTRPAGVRAGAHGRAAAQLARRHAGRAELGFTATPTWWRHEDDARVGGERRELAARASSRIVQGSMVSTRRCVSLHGSARERVAHGLLESASTACDAAVAASGPPRTRKPSPRARP